MKIKIKTVFIILCYRETSDVINLIESLNAYKDETAIVLVNSYYDETSKMIFEDIAKKHRCNFINIENKGYGYGNNRGIEYANENYDYEFLCITNPDIIFNKFQTELLTEKYHGAVVAPNIITKKGKRQNPYYYFHLYIVDRLKYVGLVKKIKLIYYAAVAINKVTRIVLDNLNKSNPINIYACHGSCFFLGHEAVKELKLPYNEKMFLFHEEEHLARLARLLKIPVIFEKCIEVTHFEDGSSEGIKDSTFKFMRQSYYEYHKFWSEKNTK